MRSWFWIAAPSTTSAATRSFWLETRFTEAFGISKMAMQCGGRVRITEGRLLSRNAAALTTVRQFQSETDAIREAAEPLFARTTLWVLTAFVVTVVAIMF